MQVLANLLGRWRTLSSRLFYHFGIHVATHQIRVLMICSVVITSLFYPALASYWTSKPLSHFSAHRIDHWLSSRFDNSGLADVHPPWHGYHDAICERDDAAAYAPCVNDPTVRIERVVVPSVYNRRDGALNHQTLQAMLKLEERLAAALNSPGSQACLKDETGACFVLTPLLYWNRDLRRVRSDPNMLSTINSQRNVTVYGFPVTAEMVFSGIRPSDHSPDDIAQAELLVLTYFFQDSNCISHADHAAWLALLGNTVSTLGTIETPSRPTELLSLEYRTEQTSAGRFSKATLFFYLTYIVVFLHFSGSMREMNTVHSRFGLALTGLVEILCSTVTSVSVLALWGFRVTMVPWGVLPVVIVFVGAENMFILVNAVVKTPISASVKERIAAGVSQAGTSNTLKLITYNSMLGTIAVFATGAIRQFCVFAIVVLVAHWFLIHTLFLTVLSIDLQRLELNDLLRQDPTLSKSPTAFKGAPSAVRGSSMQVVERLVRGRAAKDGSLVLILTVTLILYYMTYPSAPAVHDETDPFALHSQRPSAAPVNIMSPSWKIWKLLNPQGTALLRLRIESPSFVTLRGADAVVRSPLTTAPTGERCWWLPRYRTIVSVLKVFILPVAGTTASLYALLVQLLKNTELLEAQRHRPGEGDPMMDDARPIAPGVTFTSLSRAFATDVELVTGAHTDASCAAVSNDDVLATWNDAQEQHLLDGVPQQLRQDLAGGSIRTVSCVALDPAGRTLAVGTKSGLVGKWVLCKGFFERCHVLTNAAVRSPVVSLAFRCLLQPGQQGGAATDVDSLFSVIASFENGTVVEWDQTDSLPLVIKSTQPGVVVRTALIVGSSAVSVAFVLDTGIIEILDFFHANARWTSTCLIRIGSPTDPVTHIDRQKLDAQHHPHSVIATVTRSGLLSLWDPSSGECIGAINDAHGEVGRLRLAPLQQRPCSQCRIAPRGFLVAVSVGPHVYVYCASVAPQDNRCACALAPQLAGGKLTVGRRSRSGSMATNSGGTSPLRSRARLSTSSLTLHRGPIIPNYPISGHGFHSRRSSEKDRRANLEPFMPDEDWEITNGPSRQSDGAPLGLWKDLRLVLLTDVPCERGNWDVMGHVYVGLRRRSHTEIRSQDDAGRDASHFSGNADLHALAPAVLQRWEVWTFDASNPAAPLHASTLHALPAPPGVQLPSRAVGESSPRSRPSRQGSAASLASPYPRLPFTRISSVRAVGSRCFAGLGNTVGILDFTALMDAGC